VRAKRLKVESAGARIAAEGLVRVQLGRCRLEANLIELNGHGRAQLEQACLREGGRLRARAYRVLRERDGVLALQWPELWPCRCGLGRLLSLRAHAARWSPDDGRIALTQPLVRLAGVPLLVLPYWSVPTRPGTSGLLAPRLGYSRRDGFRIAQPLYLAWPARADLVLAPGGVIGRGPSFDTELQYFLSTAGEGRVVLRSVLEGATVRGWIHGRMRLRRGLWSLNFEPRWVSDAALLADLANRTLLEVSRYQRSRLWLGYQQAWFAVSSSFDLYQPLGRPAGLRQGGLARGRVRLDTAPMLVGPVALALEAELSTGQNVDPVIASRDIDGIVRFSRGLGLWLAPTALLQRACGPVRLASLLGYRFRGAWGYRESRQRSGEADSVHALRGAVEIALPLARTYRLGRYRSARSGASGQRDADNGGQLHLWHEVEPYLASQLLTVTADPRRAPVLFDQPLLVPGHFAGPGVRTSLRGSSPGGRRWLHADGRLLLGNEGALLALHAQGRPSGWLRTDLRLLYDFRSGQLASVDAGGLHLGFLDHDLCRLPPPTRAWCPAAAFRLGSGSARVGRPRCRAAGRLAARSAAPKARRALEAAAGGR
jgi:hypothetical protein